MLSVLRHRAYRHLLAAQIVALVGTGLATVALGLLAYDIAGADAGSVLGTALAIKMVAYVTIAPAAGAVAARLPRRTLMVAADVIRAGAALVLPFVDQVWQVYVLIFLLQSASAVFTPAFQALVPEVLPAERDYTHALSLSRLAYDLESLFSPAVAAALLSLVTYDRLFLGTMLGFSASAALVVSAVLPVRAAADGTTRTGPRTADACTGAATGTRLFLAVPQLRGLLLLNLAVASAGAMVTVNTVVYVRDHLGRGAADVSLALGAYGGGSMTVALLLPRVLERVPDRTVMLRGALLLTAVFAVLALLTPAAGGDWRWPALLLVWAAFGAACSTVLTPTGRADPPLGPARAAHVRVRRAVHPVPRMLAADVPAGRPARRGGGPGTDRADARRAHPGRRAGSRTAVAPGRGGTGRARRSVRRRRPPHGRGAGGERPAPAPASRGRRSLTSCRPALLTRTSVPAAA
ncbi:MFS transporter [Streptomyces thermocoprophilus]